MNVNLKLGPLHLSTKPAEIMDALKSAKRDYLDPLLKIVKDKLNEVIERREAAKRERLEATEVPHEPETVSDFDDTEEDDREVTETELDEIERLEAARDCED